MVYRNASLFDLAARAGIAALALVLCGARGLAQPSLVPATPQQYELGQPISLDKGMTLTVVVKKPQGATITSDINRTIAWGLEVSLTFANTGKEPVQQTVLAGIKPDFSHVTLVGKMNKQLAPVAMKIEQQGRGIGYRTVDTPGGILIRGCVDNGPVGLSDARNRPIGVGGIICTKPGETDTVLVMFGKPEALRKAGVKSVRVTCEVCPKGGLLVNADLDKILSTP